MSKKHLFKLGLVAVALLLIPRRSSKKSDVVATKSVDQASNAKTKPSQATNR